MLTVTVLPAARSVLVPEITRFCACSITLMTSSPATVSMRRPGSWASMVTSRKTIRYCRARSSRWPIRSGRRCRARLTDSGLTAGSSEIVLYGSRVCLPAEDNRDGIARCRVRNLSGQGLPCGTSAALTILSPAKLLRVTTGSELSTSTSCVAAALLPTLSVTLAVTV